MLTDKQSTDVCNLYTGAYQCRYLSIAGNGCHCLKKNSIQKAKIDKKAQDYIDEMNKKGIDPYQGNFPIYDGGVCPGFPLLSTKLQGKP